MNSLNVVRIKNAIFYAYHGVFQGEHNLGGKFEFDADLYYDFAPAIESDSLKRTVDYERVYAVIQRIASEKRYHLLEALANAIAKGLLKEFYNLEMVTLRIRKPHPPIKGVVDYVEVEYSQKR
jgi:7,8-dihydroneopterin aldolase/epimerase/oxygenase